MEPVCSSLTSPYANDQIVVFVKASGLHSKPSGLSRYHQIQIYTGNTFEDLLHLLLEVHKVSGILSESDVTNILRLNVKVHHQNKIDGEHFCANMGASCSGLKAMGNCLVHYEFQEATPPKKEPINPFMQLMDAQNRRVFPDPYANPHNFAMKVYNFIIDDLVKGDFSVQMDVKGKLAKLCRAIRDTLVMLEKRVSKSRLPKRFMFDFQRFASRDRTTTTRLAEVQSYLIISVAECQAFLMTARWTDFYIDLQLLIPLLEEVIVQNHNNASKARKRLEFQISDGIGDRLKGEEIVPPLKACGGSMTAHYMPLRKLLLDVGDFKFIRITIDQMNNWDPPLSVDEIPERGRQRRKYFRDRLQLDFAIGKVLYVPGGRIPSLLYVWKHPEAHCNSKNSILLLHRSILNDMPKYFGQCHFNNLRRKFGDALGPGAPPHLLEAVFRDLTGDATKIKDSSLAERLSQYLVSNCDPEFWPDMRALMNGAKHQYEPFFDTLSSIVDEVTGATANRHGEQRVLSSTNQELASSTKSVVSIPALMKLTQERMSQSDDHNIRNSSVPSVTLVALSFSPQYPHRKIAENFRPRIALSRGIVKATMRKENIDGRWVNKQNIYVNSFIVDINALLYKGVSTPRASLGNGLVMSKGATKVSVDDKAAVSVGEPGFPCRSNARKMYASIVANSEVGKATAGDHDFHRASVRPSMTLFMTTPLESRESWRTGKVTCSLKDCATQRSSPMRHSVEFIQQCRKQVERDDQILFENPLSLPLEDTSLPFILVQRSDGGADRNTKNASVIVASIHTFLQLNLDALVAMVTAADLSYVNEVEGVMPVANLALQNQSFERKKMSVAYEALFKNANSGAQIRDIVKKQATPEEAQNAWQASLEPVIELIGNRMSQVEYTGHPVELFQPTTDEEIEKGFDFLREKVDSKIDASALRWTDVRKEYSDLQQFIQIHCKTSRYCLEIKKCGDTSCRACKPVSPAHFFS
jgi:hypothetical protein